MHFGMVQRSVVELIIEAAKHLQPVFFNSPHFPHL